MHRKVLQWRLVPFSGQVRMDCVPQPTALWMLNHGAEQRGWGALDAVSL